jgi:hypothetical protein
MHRTSWQWIVALMGLVSASLQAQDAPATPCAAAEHRQFDFWLGDWEVLGAGGKVAGTNRITRDYDGCVLREQYDTGRGYRGSSFNVYDAGRRQWHQTWVDTTGTLLLLDGGLVDGRMVLEGTTLDARGASIRHRITWTPNPDGTVRQFWESTNAAGEWGVAFDGQYVRTKPAPVASAAAAAAAPIDDVAWLAGCWAAQDGEPGTVEHWLAPAAGTMFGVSRTVRGGRAALFEFMTIRTTAEGQLVFVAQPGGSPPTEFPAKSRNSTEVTFENTSHDFPNRVTYRKTGPESMLGRIEGTLDGAARAIDFRFKRAPCPVEDRE